MRLIMLSSLIGLSMAASAFVTAASAQMATAPAATTTAPAKPGIMARMAAARAAKTAAKPATGAAMAAKPAMSRPMASAPRAARTASAGGARKPRTAQSIACSGQADSKGLHGKPRDAFMRSCKKG